MPKHSDVLLKHRLSLQMLPGPPVCQGQNERFVGLLGTEAARGRPGGLQRSPDGDSSPGLHGAQNVPHPGPPSVNGVGWGLLHATCHGTASSHSASGESWAS